MYLKLSRCVVPGKKIARNKTLPSADPATARGRAQPDVNRFPKYYSNDILR